jgi:hypothetical protein
LLITFLIYCLTRFSELGTQNTVSKTFVLLRTSRASFGSWEEDFEADDCAFVSGS